VLLRLAAGLTADEVAATLGKTAGAVKALQHRGLASLARTLETANSTTTTPVQPADPPTR
jgi:RNA polymerase sigma-70 factor, ECF subfamily